MRRDVADRLVSNLFVTPAPQLVTITGEGINVLGQMEMEVENLGVISVNIVSDMNHKFVLGCDNLYRYPFHLSRTRFTWRDTQFEVSVDTSCSSTEADHSLVDTVLRRHAPVFAKAGEPLKAAQHEGMRILTNGPPIHQRAYRTNLTKRETIKTEVESMLKQCIIRPSQSPWSSPVTLVPKKDGTVRFCIDFRRLNTVTIKDRHPLPLIQDVFDQMGGAKLFTTLDLKSGYWQVPMHEDSIAKTAFVCHLGQYEFIRMPFGLCNAPAAFQRYMNKVLYKFIGRCAMVYLDDIVIYSKTENEHTSHLDAILSTISDAGLTLKPSKCTFARAEVKLLGYVINEHGIRPDKEKTAAFAQMPCPKTVKQVQSFLGATGYYRQCIPNYAKIAEPIVRLIRKEEKWQWSDEQQKAWTELRDVMTSSDIMAHPQLDKPYQLYTDACDYAVGAILCQKDSTGVERPIHYLSHQLSSVQRKWSTIEKEAYAVVYALKKLRAYLLGADFTVYSDHRPLSALFTREMDNTKIQRWAVLLAEYGAKIRYQPGRKNERADMLSRLQPSQTEVNVIDATWEQVPRPNVQSDDIRYPFDWSAERIRRLQQDQYAEEIDDAINNDESRYVLIDNQLYSSARPFATAPDKPRLLLPTELRGEVIKACHEQVGHMSVVKTLRAVQEDFVWPGMKKSVGEYIKTCGLCQVHYNRPVYGQPGDPPQPSYVMQIVSLDLIGPLMRSEAGNMYVLTAIDHFSGWAEAYPIPAKTCEFVLSKLTSDFFPRHGFPEIIITDNGTEFKGEIPTYFRACGIKHNTTTPRHPQSNGKIERFNGTLKSILRKLINQQRANWEKQLGPALLAYRVSTSATTGYSPFYLQTGRRPRLPLSQLLPMSRDVTPQSRLYDLSLALDATGQNLQRKQEINKAQRLGKANVTPLQAGDSVVLKAAEPMSLTSKWDHLYEVTRVRGPVINIRHQQSGQTLTVNNEKLRKVDPDIVWNAIRPRPKRQSNVHMNTGLPYSGRRHAPIPSTSAQADLTELEDDLPSQTPTLPFHTQTLDNTIDAPIQPRGTKRQATEESAAEGRRSVRLSRKRKLDYDQMDREGVVYDNDGMDTDE
jgi:hypothetical protein